MFRCSDLPFGGSRVVPWGRTDRHDKIVAFRNFAKVPKNCLGLVEHDVQASCCGCLSSPFSTLPSGTQLIFHNTASLSTASRAGIKDQTVYNNRYYSVIRDRTRDYAHRSVARIIYDVRRQLRKPLIVTASCLKIYMSNEIMFTAVHVFF